MGERHAPPSARSRAVPACNHRRVVSVTRRAVCVRGEAVARIVDGRLVVADLQGHLIPALAERIAPMREELARRDRARGDEPAQALVLFADGGTRQSTLVDIAYTANRAGFRTYYLGLAVDLPLDVPFAVGLELEPPRYVADGRPSYFQPRDHVEVYIDATHVLAHADDRPTVDFAFDHRIAADHHALATFARSQTAAAPYDVKTAAVAVLSADPEVTLDRFVAVMSAFTGHGCDLRARIENDAKRCVFPRTVIEAN